MKLVAQHLSWEVNGRRLLEDVNLEIRPGEKLGLVGPNGSGKTTLLRLLAGLQKPRAGHVWLDNQILHSMRQREIARVMAFVEQQSMAIDRIGVREAVSLGRTPFLSPLRGWSVEDDAIVDRAMLDAGITALSQRLWHTLSGGEAQRVQIARALAQQPGILLLDEPTNHLDIRHQLSILSLLWSLPVTVVVALHDLNQAMDFDRIGVMDGGRLVDIGPPEAVLTPARLRTTFGVIAHRLDDPVHGVIMRFTSAVSP